MPEPLENYDKSVRLHILNDVIEKVPIEESFENLCEEIGNTEITFYDFQFWFYRFLKLKPELDFDKSIEPEPLQFSDLPLYALQLILNKLELVDRVVLRKVSKPLRDFIEKQNNMCDYMTVCCQIDFIVLVCESRCITYAKSSETLGKSEDYFGYLGSSKIFDNNYESEAFNDLAWIFKNPKLQLQSLSFENETRDEKRSEEDNGMVRRCYKIMENVLKSLKHQVAVESLTIYVASPDNLLTILQHFKPDYLATIRIEKLGTCDSWENAEHAQKIQQIVSLDQWKQARSLSLEYLLKFFPQNGLTHFKRLTIAEDGCQPGDLIRLRNMFVKPKTLESCEFFFIKVFGTEDYKIGVPGAQARDRFDIRRYMIPNSDEYLEFKFSCYGGYVRIVKKTLQ